MRQVLILTFQVSAIDKMISIHCLNDSSFKLCFSISAANQAWDTSSLEDMQWMFYDTTGFTGDIRYEAPVMLVGLMAEF